MTGAHGPRRHWAWWLLGLGLLLAWHYWPHAPGEPGGRPGFPGPIPRAATEPGERSIPGADPALPASRLPSFLPAEARTTVDLIARGGPFPHRQDGSVFGNREGHLPREPRGWYREYTVDTPGLSHRGTRRIITGGNPPRTWYYTSDHYDSFRRFDPDGAPQGSP